MQHAKPGKACLLGLRFHGLVVSVAVEPIIYCQHGSNH